MKFREWLEKEHFDIIEEMIRYKGNVSADVDKTKEILTGHLQSYQVELGRKLNFQDMVNRIRHRMLRYDDEWKPVDRLIRKKGMTKWDGKMYDLSDPYEQAELWNKTMNDTANLVVKFVQTYISPKLHAPLLAANQNWLKSKLRKMPQPTGNPSYGRTLAGGQQPTF